MIRYMYAPDIARRIQHIAARLEMEHLDIGRVVCVRSKGSQSRRIIARCHALPRIMQFALATKAHYIVEVISERFDRLSDEEQIKVLIHELLHIPKSFGGGFKYHGYVNEKRINLLYRMYSQNN